MYAPMLGWCNAPCSARRASQSCSECRPRTPRDSRIHCAEHFCNKFHSKSKIAKATAKVETTPQKLRLKHTRTRRCQTDDKIPRFYSSLNFYKGVGT